MPALASWNALRHVSGGGAYIVLEDEGIVLEDEEMGEMDRRRPRGFSTSNWGVGDARSRSWVAICGREDECKWELRVVVETSVDTGIMCCMNLKGSRI